MINAIRININISYCKLLISRQV